VRGITKGLKKNYSCVDFACVAFGPLHHAFTLDFLKIHLLAKMFDLYKVSYKQWK
jgi:hypothetical protein